MKIRKAMRRWKGDGEEWRNDERIRRANQSFVNVRDELEKRRKHVI